MENIEEKMEKIQRKLSEINRINNLTAHVINVKISVDSSTSVYQGNLIESCEKCSAQKLKAFCNGVSSCCEIEIGNYGTLCDVISLDCDSSHFMRISVCEATGKCFSLFGSALSCQRLIANN